MKLLGIVLVVVCCSLCGGVLASRIRGRCRALGRSQLFLHLLSERLQYTLTPLGELFEQLSSEPLLEGLDFIPACSRKMAQNVPFPKAFMESVREAGCPLNREDRALLSELTSFLGAADVDSQMEGLRLVKANLAQQAQIAREDSDKRGKLYASLGVLSGVALAIMLI